MKETKKTLINSKVEMEELQKVSEIITRKALKVISCSGCIYALELLEGKDVNTMEDLKQEVALQIILDDYMVTKNSFKMVRSYIYKNKEKDGNRISYYIDNDTTGLDNEVYCSWLHETDSKNECKEIRKISVDDLELSERQKEIFEMYLSGTSCRKIAELLDISVGTVSNTIKRIKNKSVKLMGV
jgi:RNA polymerase sigma factor (sigma-70 family)